MTCLSRSILFVSVVLPVAALAQLPPGLNPIEKNVDCGKPNASITNTIDNLEPYKNYIIHIAGTCTENVGVSQFEGRFLLLDGGGTAVINNAGPGSTVNINNSRGVFLRGLTINHNAFGPAAVFFGNCRNCAVNGSTINGVRSGISFNGTEGGASNTTVLLSDSRPGATGINVQTLSSINLNGVKVQRSGPRDGSGIQAGTGSVVNVNPGMGGSLVEGFAFGVFVDGGATAFVSGSGVGAPGVIIQNNANGVLVNSARAIVRNPGALITLNDRHGLSAAFNSDVGVQNGARIVLNGSVGVILTFSSTAQFQGAAAVDHLFCGTHSFAVGGASLVTPFTNTCGPGGINLDPGTSP